MANITFPFAALMLLHWALHGEKASTDLIFFASGVDFHMRVLGMIGN